MNPRTWILFASPLLVLTTACSRLLEPPCASDALQEASCAARNIDEQHSVMVGDRALSDIVVAQLHAGNMDRALETADAIGNGYSRNAALWEISKAWAEAGHKDRALEILRRTEQNTPSGTDAVLAALARSQARAGDLAMAEQTARSIKSAEAKAEALTSMAVASAKTGRARQADILLKQALGSAACINDEYSSFSTTLEIAKAHVGIGDKVEGQNVCRNVIESAASFKNSWAKVAAFREAGEFLTETGDASGAVGAFAKALEAVPEIGEPPHWANYLSAAKRVHASRMIACAQAKAGFIKDALVTVDSMPDGKVDWTYDDDREEALRDIATAQAKTGDVKAALATASRITHFLQYNDESLLEIVRLQVAQGDLAGALTTAARIGTPSRKAQAVLEVATVYAKAANKETALNVAKSVSLGRDRWGWGGPENHAFDYDRPPTWAVLYEQLPFFTMTSYFMTLQTAGDLAAAAMTFDQGMGGRSADLYARAFQETHPHILRRLAQAQAQAGDLAGAVSWARQMADPERRACALLGAAEGHMAKSGT